MPNAGSVPEAPWLRAPNAGSADGRSDALALGELVGSDAVAPLALLGFVDFGGCVSCGPVCDTQVWYF